VDEVTSVIVSSAIIIALIIIAMLVGLYFCFKIRRLHHNDNAPVANDLK
jgi:hypothetical protein